MNPSTNLFSLFTVIIMTANSISAQSIDGAGRQMAQPLDAELQSRCMEILRSGMNSEEFWPAMHAAEALTLAGAGSEVITAINDRLAVEKDDQRRCGLARELVRAGDRTHLPLLFQTLQEQKSTGRTHAAESLYKLGEAGDGMLLRIAMQQSESVPLKVMAAGALVKAGDDEAMALIRQLIKSEDRTSRNLSAWILGRHGNESDVAPILAAMKSETDEMSLTFLAVSLACLGNSEGRSTLLSQLDSHNNTAKAMAAEFAGLSRTIESRGKLIQLLDDPVLDVRIRAAQSLIVLAKPGQAK